MVWPRIFWPLKETIVKTSEICIFIFLWVLNLSKTLTFTYGLHIIVFCPEHPKWHQNPKFTILSETMSYYLLVLCCWLLFKCLYVEKEVVIFGITYYRNEKPSEVLNAIQVNYERLPAKTLLQPIACWFFLDTISTDVSNVTVVVMYGPVNRYICLVSYLCMIVYTRPCDLISDFFIAFYGRKRSSPIWLVIIINSIWYCNYIVIVIIHFVFSIQVIWMYCTITINST